MIRLDTFLAANPDAYVHGPVFAERFDRFSFDSRIIQPGELFLAVRTAKADGHDHIAAACHGGAAGVVCQRPVDLSAFGATCIVVADTETAIRRHAGRVIRQAGIPVVAITGSVGKTTTKEMVAHVLGARFKVFRNPANFSGRFGLPIAIGELEPQHTLAVLEMAVDQFGEMALMTEMAPPTVGAVTLVAPAHLAAFGDLDGVAREKGTLVERLPAHGLAVLNGDDPRVAAMQGRTATRVALCHVDDAAGEQTAPHRVLSTPGGSPGGDSDRDPTRQPPMFQAHGVRVGIDGTRFVLETPGGARLDVALPWLGRHFAGAALIAAAVANHFDLPLTEVATRLASLPEVPGRLNRIPGLGGALILDDSYNASPEAVLAGLDVLADLPAARRLAILGDMAELGDASDESHRRVGRRAARVVDRLVTRGPQAALIAEGARAAGLDPAAIAVTLTTEDAVAATRPHLGPGVVAFVKGSAVARMEQVVAGLMAEPADAARRLVRQDAAWRQIVVLQPDRPTWVEIDLGAIAGNTRALARIAAPAEVMAVLKADGYGHGAVRVAHTALRNGASACGVACLSEAQVLRRAGIDAPILVLGYTPAWQARDAVRAGVAITVFDVETAVALDQAARALDSTIHVHVKVDTGMRRLGLAPDAVPVFLRRLTDLPGLVVDGVFTHTACADDLSPVGRTATAEQLAQLRRVLDHLDAAGLRPPKVHAANSALMLAEPGARYDMVRPGLALYGLAPSDAVDIAAHGLRPALAWKTQVAQVRELVVGDAVGYGHAWRATRASRIATIPVGYADGFRRAPKTWRHVLVQGSGAPLVGRVSMDQCAVDVTDIPGVRQGDEVVLIGTQGERRITAEDVGRWLGTINYEVVSTILARVPRVS